MNDFAAREAQPDSRDWEPPDDMAEIFKAIRKARDAIHIDGDGVEYAVEYLIDAVEALATRAAGGRGRHV